MKILPVRLTAAAKRDVKSAQQWYRAEAPQVEPAFRQAVRDTIRRIGREPHLYAVVHRELHRALVHRFPYSVFYLVKEDAIVVTAVIHQSRNPRTWQDRSG